MSTGEKFVSKFVHLTDMSDGRSPGMAEALETLDDAYWQAQDQEKAAEVSPGMREKIKKLYQESSASDYAQVAKWAIRATVKDPLALVAALPFVDALQTRRTLDIISKVPEGAEMVEAAKRNSTQFRLDFFRDGASFMPISNVVSADGASPPQISYTGLATKGARIAMFLHELQHLMQYMAGIRDVEKGVSPVEHMWYNRAIEADAEATAVDIAYKLHLIGEKDAWHFLRSKDSLSCSAMARAYEEAAQKDPDAIYDGRAKRAAYDTWYEARMRSKQTISAVYNGQGLRFADAWRKLFKGDIPPLDPKVLGRADIEKLGALSSVNYMTLPGYRAVDDISYRKPDWNVYQARHLADLQTNYQQKAMAKEAATPLQPSVPKFAALQPAPPSAGPKSKV